MAYLLYQGSKTIGQKHVKGQFANAIRDQLRLAAGETGAHSVKIIAWRCYDSGFEVKGATETPKPARAIAASTPVTVAKGLLAAAPSDLA